MRTHLLLVATNITIGLLFFSLASVSASEYEQNSLDLEQNTAALLFKRKLLVTGNKCSRNDVVIAQSQTGSQYNGIPTFRVEITNTCLAGHSISNIHLYCGWFTSSTLINPRTFKRLAYDDCLVNDGKPVAAGLTISFKYTTTFKYPLSVSSYCWEASKHEERRVP